MEAGKTGVGGRVQNVGQQMREIQHQVDGKNIGRLVRDDLAFNQLDPAAAIGKFILLCGKFFGSQFVGVIHLERTRAVRLLEAVRVMKYILVRLL